jgi:macrolide-specific efflux system membrane fusion protein
MKRLRETQSAARACRSPSASASSPKLSSARQRVNLSYATITAPISGVIGSVTTQEGETVAAGLNAPTFVVIVDLDRLQVNAFVDEVDIGKVALGQRVTFNCRRVSRRRLHGSRVRDLSERHHSGQRRQICRRRSHRRRESPPSAPEMTASVRIQLETRNRARDSLPRHPAGRPAAPSSMS